MTYYRQFVPRDHDLCDPHAAAVAKLLRQPPLAWDNGLAKHAPTPSLRRRTHEPIPEQGRWPAHVVRGYFAYHAVPTNFRRLGAF